MENRLKPKLNRKLTLKGFLLLIFGILGFFVFQKDFLFKKQVHSPSPKLSQSFQAKVIGISDGDTVQILKDNHPIKVRLWGIDCPELGQPFGQRAKQFTSQMVFDQLVTIHSKGKDDYQRILALVQLSNGQWLNQELLKAGLAWWFQKYAPFQIEYEKFQKEAQNSKKGLWKDPNPRPPWKWRKRFS